MEIYTIESFEKLLNAIPESPSKVPTNTIAHIFRNEEKENFISDWLAFLLNPEYTGSTEPLSALLELASVTETVDVSDISIIREYAFKDQRRIDFLIETSSHIIGIENKIWSGLQKDQLKDYQDQLSKDEVLKGRTLIMILLYPQRNKSLPIHSAEDLCSFRPVTYEDLVAEFRKIKFNIFDNLRATVLMEDYIVHMEEYIMKETSDAAVNWDMWHFEAEHRDRITELKRSLKDSRNQFDKYIADRMDAITRNREDRDQWKKTMTGTYFQLYKTNWKNGLVHFELLKTTQDDLVPKKLKVVLHTHERKKEWRTDQLRGLGEQIGEQEFGICYKSPKEFETSMDKVFEELERLVKTYTEQIDIEIAKSAAKQ